MAILQRSTLAVFVGSIKPMTPLVFYCVKEKISGGFPAKSLEEMIYIAKDLYIYRELHGYMFMPGMPVSYAVRKRSSL